MLLVDVQRLDHKGSAPFLHPNNNILRLLFLLPLLDRKRRLLLHLLDPVDHAVPLLPDADFPIEHGHLQWRSTYLNLEKLCDLLVVLHAAESLHDFECEHSCDNNIMLGRLTKRMGYLYRTHEQTTFLDSLPRMKFGSDEQLIENIRAMYDKRELLEECEAFSEVSNRIENYLLKNSKCTVAHIQCFNILKEMRMVSSPFRHNLHQKYYRFLIAPNRPVKNEHLEKYLWFLFEEGRFQREMFREAAETHTVTLFEIYEYMNSLKDMPTWEPYIRIVNMLSYLGHQVEPHQGLGAKDTITRIQHKYYPYISRLFTPQQMVEFQSKDRYDNPFLTYLCNEYIIKNASRYDSYLQRVELVELEQQYERILDVMDWSEFPPFLDLMIANYELNGGNDELESRVTQIFFRLCEHDDINLETVASIFSSYLARPNFMLSRKFPIITRCTDSIFKRGLEDFAYLPADAFVSLLDSSRKLQMDKDSRAYLQQFLCMKVANKAVWGEGEAQRLRVFAETNEVKGGVQLLAYLNQLQTEA